MQTRWNRVISKNLYCKYVLEECCCRFVGREAGKEGTDWQPPAKIGEAVADDVVLLLPQQSEQRAERG